MADEKKGKPGGKEPAGKDAKDEKDSKEQKGGKEAKDAKAAKGEKGETKGAEGEAKPAEGAAAAAPKPKAAPKAPWVPKKKKEPAKVIKERSLKALVRIASSYPTVGIVDVSGIPAANMMQIRGEMRGKLEVRVAKKTLIERAVKDAGGGKKGLVALLDSMTGQPGLMGTTYDPFKAALELNRRRTKLAARGGEKAPDDIVIPEGPTAFKPGPIVGELQKAGIPAAIDSGKVVIKSEKTVVKRGDTISRDLALALAKMEIKPLEVGLAVRAVFDGESVLRPEVFAIDEGMVMGQLATAHGQTLALAMEIGWITPETVGLLVRKAVGQAMALGHAVPGTDFKGLDAVAAAGPAASGGGEEAKPEKKEEKKVSDEDAAAGLSSLFG
jgi:large subunit ribosomal protein L10